jgi:hypothetical protein
MTGVATDLRARTGRMPAWLPPAAVAGGALVACAYVSAVDPNRSSAYPQCPWKLVTGLDCPMCGATRAVHSLLRGDVVGAMDHNLLFVLLLPVFIYAFVAWTATRMGRPLPPVPITSRWVWVPLTVVMFAFTIVRNIPGTPLHWLNSSAAT